MKHDNQKNLARITLFASVTVLVALVGPALCEGENTVMRILDFTAGAASWSTIDDVVMGGISASHMTRTDEAAVFHGRVSLDNNGGFSSARSPDGEYDLSPFDGLRIRVRGDGKVYSLRIRCEDTMNGMSFRSKFTAPAGEWSEIVLPFDDFKPVFRGRVLTDHPPLDVTRVTGFGLLIADAQEGDFRLDLAWIEGVREQP